MTQKPTRSCPSCGEQIQPRAIKCRFCGESLDAGAPPRRRAARIDTSSEPTTILVFGLIGLLACALFGPFAWLRANEYQRRCKARNVVPSGTANVGKILGIIATLELALLIVIGLLAFILPAFSSAAGFP